MAWKVARVECPKAVMWKPSGNGTAPGKWGATAPGYERVAVNQSSGWHPGRVLRLAPSSELTNTPKGRRSLPERIRSRTCLQTRVRHTNQQIVRDTASDRLYTCVCRQTPSLESPSPIRQRVEWYSQKA